MIYNKDFNLVELVQPIQLSHNSAKPFLIYLITFGLQVNFQKIGNMHSQTW